MIYLSYVIHWYQLILVNTVLTHGRVRVLAGAGRDDVRLQFDCPVAGWGQE